MTQAEGLAEVWRGDFLECLHRGHAVVVDHKGGTIAAWGNPEQVILPRSACKIFQAIPLVETGAASAFDLTQRQLAFACASHQGATIHVTETSRWLDKIGCCEQDLRCGAHIPDDKDQADMLVRLGRRPDQRHNNCSGKHTGFLTVGAHLKAGPDYLNLDHPVQMAVKSAIETVCQAETQGHATDGCSAPNFALRLRDLAFGMAQMAVAKTGARAQLVAAVAKHPEMVAGHGRACTDLIQATKGRVIVKTGAEGVFTAIVRDKGLGIALKVEDGATRASECALTALLVHLGVADADHPMIQKRLFVRLTNCNGHLVGQIRPAAGLAAPEA